MSRLFAVSLLTLLWGTSMAAHTDEPALTAQWIWHAQDSYHQYNDTVIAKRAVELPAVSAAEIRITADTVYRLFVNDTWVLDGPSRAWPDRYQYDVIDVTPYVKEGANEIRVIAKYFGVGTFHQIPQQAGLLVQLDATAKDGDAIRVVSDESWKVATAKAWLPNTVKRCIQMGPYEIYDARLEDDLAFGPAAVLYTADEGPWKNLNRRDCPKLTMVPFDIGKPIASRTVASDWTCFAFPTARLLYPGLIEANGKVSMASAAATIVHADEDMELHLEAPNCTVTVNGKPGNDGAHALKKGDNFLFMVVSKYFGHWQKDTAIRFIESEGYALKNPVDSAASSPWCWVPFEDAKYVNTDYAFNLLPPTEQHGIETRIQRVIDDYLKSVTDVALFESTFGTSIVALDSTLVMDDPHWQFSSREPLDDSAQIEDGALLITPAPSGDFEVVYDLGEQNIGYYDFVIDAAAGTIVDIAGVEYIAPGGRVQHTDPYRNSMRYICKEGENRFTSLDRRSQRFLFVTFRNCTDPVKIERFQLIESTYPVDPVGTFASSDPNLGKIWDISARTLKLCMEDTYTDCPLYEQTHWVGDARNEGVFGLTAFGAADLAKRCARLTAYSLDADYPIALCQTPSTWGVLLPAWSFLWGISVWDYYEYSGDAAFVEEMWPYVMKNLHNAREFSDERGLFSGPFWNMFDWSGIDDGHKTVTHNSMFVVGAIDAALKCAAVVDDDDAKAWLTEYRKSLVKAINALYDPERGAYPDSIHEDGTISASSSMHTSFLALLYDIAPEEIRGQLLNNVLDPPEGTVQVGSPFAIMYEYEALEKLSQDEAIVASIRKNYVPMLEAGATTVWESFPTGTTGSGGFPTRSHTHAWSSAPVHFLNRVVLGIRPEGIGTERVVISPKPCGNTWAKGSSATAKGPVDVEWKLEGDSMAVTAHAPKGVALAFEANEALAGVRVTFNGKAVN